MFYSAYNIARGLAGARLGLAAAIPLSRLLVEAGLRGTEGGETATRLLMELYPFSPQLEDIVVPYAAMLASIVAATVLPPLLYARDNTPTSRAVREEVARTRNRYTRPLNTRLSMAGYDVLEISVIIQSNAITREPI